MGDFYIEIKLYRYIIKYGKYWLCGVFHEWMEYLTQPICYEH